MSGFSPQLPLTLDPDDGYTLNKSLKDVAKQNFKMLVLTNPGERIMDPEFGVGILAYLFENNSPSTYGKIEARIRQQASKYLPYISVDQVSFDSYLDKPDITDNFLGVRIRYAVQKLGISDMLEI
jgi:phage baseplate assembly protein W